MRYLFAALALLFFGFSQGQTFPSKPITMVVGFEPGGGTDTVARVVAKFMADNIGQQVLVENRAGAGGNIAVDHTIKSAPDGYTIVLANVGALTVNPHLMKLGYDPLRDLAPITLHTGVSSLEAHEAPYPERFRVPAATAERVNDARLHGHRVVAVGTTSVRALESAVGPDGCVEAADGWTDLVISPERDVRVVDGLLTGWHEPEATHLAMLEAVAGSKPTGARVPYDSRSSVVAGCGGTAPAPVGPPDPITTAVPRLSWTRADPLRGTVSSTS